MYTAYLHTRDPEPNVINTGRVPIVVQGVRLDWTDRSTNAGSGQKFDFFSSFHRVPLRSTLLYGVFVEVRALKVDGLPAVHMTKKKKSLAATNLSMKFSPTVGRVVIVVVARKVYDFCFYFLYKFLTR